MPTRDINCYLTTVMLTNDDQQIVYPVVARSGINDQGKTIPYYLNYSGKDQSVNYNFDKGTDLLTNKAFKKGDSFVLKPWALFIVEGIIDSSIPILFYREQNSDQKRAVFNELKSILMPLTKLQH